MGPEPRHHARAGRIRSRRGALALAGALLASCAAHRDAARPEVATALVTAPSPEPAAASPDIWASLVPWPDEARERLAARAARYLGHGRRPFLVGGTRFNPDCSGFVEAVYHAEGIPLREAMALAPEDRGSAVAALFRIVAARGVLFRTEMAPLPGDLVFWNDTYDRNGNGALDDPLTHVGIVEGVAADGTIRFLHRGLRGVARGVMNLARFDVERDGASTVNSRLRLPRTGEPAARGLAAWLFAAFGRFDPARLAAALEGSPGLSLRALGLADDE